MKRILFRPAALALLASGMMLASCNSEPKATEADKTATVVSSDTNEASDSTATTASGDSATGGTTATPTDNAGAGK